MNEQQRQPSLDEVERALSALDTIYLALNDLKVELSEDGGPLDTAPVISEPRPVAMVAGETVEVVVTATDVEGPPVFTLLTLLDWLDADTATPGLLRLKLSPPADLTPDSYAIELQATDAGGLTDVASLLVTVTAPQTAPVAPVPTGLVVAPGAGSLALSWEQAPADVTQVFVSWGADGRWLGNTRLEGSATEYTLRGLAAEQVTVDVGFIRGAQWPSAAELVRVQGTPDSPPEPPTPEAGLYPTAETAGIRVVKEGLRTIDGRHVISSPGKVAGLRVIGQLFIDSANVEVEDCWITGIYAGDGALRNFNYQHKVAPGLVVHHCKIDGKVMREPPGYGVIGAAHLHHCDISGCADAVKLGTVSGELIEDNYMHHFALGFSSVHGGPTHNDGLQAQAGNGGIIRRNAIIGPFTDGGQGQGDAKASANGGVFLKSDSGPIRNYKVHDNYVVGWGFCIYCYNNVSNTEVYNNVLGSGAGFAAYGPLQLVGSAAGGVKAWNNKTQTGAPVGNRNA